MSDQLRGKSIIITGAGSATGIGAGLAYGLAERGANIAVCDINEEAANKVADDIADKVGVKTIALKVDVTNRAQMREIIERTVSAFGQLDVMINNAGIIEHATFLEMTEQSWRRVMDTNAMGAMIGIQEAAKQMIAQAKGGKIINMTSIASKQSYPEFAHYCASKWAVAALSQAAARQFAEHKININCMGPGIVKTAMMDGLDREFVTKGLKEPGQTIHDLSVGIPLGRYSLPSDLVGTAAFLASTDSDYMTGQNIMCDGGMVML